MIIQYSQFNKLLLFIYVRMFIEIVVNNRRFNSFISKACATIVDGVLNFKTLRYDTRYFIEYSNTFQQMFKIVKYRTSTFCTHCTHLGLHYLKFTT